MDDFMEKLVNWAHIGCDLVLLNILWLVCSLPVVTIGASTAALHTVARKMAAGEPYTVWSGFWQGFKENWKQGTAVTVILGLVMLVCLADFTIGVSNPGTIGMVCQIVGALGMIAAVFTLTMAYPLLTRYRMRLSTVLRNALLLSLSNPHIVLAGLAAAALFPLLGSLNIYLRIIATPGWLLLGCGLPVLVEQLLMRRVYARLEPAEKPAQPDCEDSQMETQMP